MLLATWNAVYAAVSIQNRPGTLISVLSVATPMPSSDATVKTCAAALLARVN